ncbi:SEC23-interacting protein [Ranitomeya imitator]|uniref:SEC23-interacting protein n=1 Tax=Ranitomeya imitator TaxID=111125 RepID=UPI0037E87E74
MAEKGTSVTNRNLLFSPSELSFSVPFIPVGRVGPFSSDGSVEVGEEDSFLGQTASTTHTPQTFSYFSQASSLTSSSDPFASIGQIPATTAAQVPGSIAFPKPPMSTPSGVQNGQNFMAIRTSSPFPTIPPRVSSDASGVFSPNTQMCHPPSMYSTPPPVISQACFNPYRHNMQSSRANPYRTPPQLQQDVPIGINGQGASGPPLYPSSSASLPPPPAAPGFIPAPMVQSFSNSKPTVTPVPITAPFFPNLYEPVQPHWFFCKLVEDREIWLPFSIYDSAHLEEVYNSVQPDPESVVVSTAGGRYDVCLYDREMKAVYWEEEDSEVRRCSWFYKGDTDSRFIPYSEDFSEQLEMEYKKAVSSNQWHRRLEFPGGETIVMHNPKVIVQFQHSAIPDEWGTPQDGQARPRVVKRGVDDHDDIPDGEVPQADHLVFMVHGIGPVCDLRFRSIIECVDDFRSVSLKLLQSHFKKFLDEGKVHRVEFLPVHWHSALHGDATGVDRHIKKITLPSIGRLRHFTNETLLDVLFYNSPTYCQTIVDKVSLEVNRLYELFMSRNPDFMGGVSVAGHSLGSLILFDMLSNQTDRTASSAASTHSDNSIMTKGESTVEKQISLLEPTESSEVCSPQGDLPCLQEVLGSLGLAEFISLLEKERMDTESLLMCTVNDLKEMGIPLGPRKKIAKFVDELSVLQIKAKQRIIQEEATLLTQREEPLPLHDGMNPNKRTLTVGASVSSIHVGYDRFETGTGQVSVHYNPLDFEPVSFFALGSPIGMFLTVRGIDRIDENYRLPTCKGFFNIYHPLDPVAYRLEPMILPDLDLKPLLVPHHKGRKRLHLELKESLSRMGSDLKHGFISSLRSAWQTLNEFARAHTSSSQLQAELEKVADQIKEEEAKQEVEAEKLESSDPWREEDLSVKIGMLNGGRRIDYVLQEKPIESFNEYLFALQSHLCYWESEDTALLILKEIYKSLNVIPDLPLH